MPIPDLRCSTWARETGVDPVGTAGCYDGYLLVEWPLPWPRDLAEVPELAPVAARARQVGFRLQALVGPSERRPGRVIRYRWDAGAGRFAGREMDARGDVGAALAFLEPGDPSGSVPVSASDLLICGHGTRDRCCGSLGTALEARAAGTGPDGLGLAPAVRVWRTSHTGGHRFAPTAIALPHGTCWGYLDADSLVEIVGRRAPVTDHLGRYRGCAGLAGPRLQALERAVLAELGWDLLDRPRWGVEDDDGRTRLVVEDRGGRRTWEARVVVRRVLAVPECGSPVTEGNKTEPELVVEDLREVAAIG